MSLGGEVLQMEDRKRMNLKDLKRRLSSLSEMEKMNETRKDQIRMKLSESESKTSELQLKIDNLKSIKDKYKEYVTKTWPTIRNSYRKIIDSEMEEPKKIDILIEKSKKSIRKKPNLQISHQKMVNFPPENNGNVIQEPEFNPESIGIDIKPEKSLKIDESSDEDEMNVEKQMASFVRPKSLENESSSDDESRIDTKIDKKSITRKKLSELHLGLESDSDVNPDVNPTVNPGPKKIDNESDSDFAFFD